MAMSAISKKLYQTLLDHHLSVRISEPIKDTQIDPCLMTYARLCDESGMPGAEVGVGKFLAEIAEYCQVNGWPPINALAVNSSSRMPGEKYDLAEGCSILHWPQQVIDVLLCHDYA